MSFKSFFSTPYNKIKSKINTGAMGALAVGGVMALAFWANSMRNERRYNPENEPPADPELGQDLPPVQNFMPPMQQNNTLMGMQPVEGPMAMKVKMQRGGMMGGPDVSAPSVMDVDGKPVGDLGNPVRA